MATKTATNGTAAKATSADHLEAMETRGPSSPGITIQLPKLDIRTVQICVVGDSPLICNRWSEKAKRMMLEKQMGTATAGKEHKDPEKDYQGSMYVIEPAKAGQPFESGRFGFPTIAFKNSAVAACTSLGKSVTKVAARQAFHVVGEFTEIEGTPQMREDMVRVGMGTADIRYRGEFPEWACSIKVKYNARVLSAEQLFNLFNTGGFAVGIGEWRPECDGSFGLFHVV